MGCMLLQATIFQHTDSIILLGSPFFSFLYDPGQCAVLGYDVSIFSLHCVSRFLFLNGRRECYQECTLPTIFLFHSLVEAYGNMSICFISLN